MPEKPDQLTSFSQSDYLTKGVRGVCYGMCRRVLELDGSQIRGAKTLEAAFETVSKRLDTKGFVSKSHDAQQSRRQSNRTTVSLPLSDRILYIVGCNINLTSGYMTRYSLASYVTKEAWSADHAVLLVGLEEGILMFDPNWGCAIWKTQAIEKLSWSEIQELIASGYKNPPPVYVVEVEV